MAFRIEVPDIFLQLAQAAMDKYFQEYKGVKKWLDSTIEQAKVEGFVRSPFGRVEHLPNIKSKYRDKRSEAERQSINMPIQSGASDIVQEQIIDIYEWFLSNPQLVELWDALLVNCVHDSVVVEVLDEHAREAALKIKKIMEDGSKFDFMQCELKVDVEIGPSYGELEEIEFSEEELESC